MKNLLSLTLLVSFIPLTFAQKQSPKKSTQLVRKAGKVSSVVFTETARPFVHASSFFRGLFSKSQSEKTQIKEKVFRFYLENEKRFNEIYKDPSIYNEYIQEHGSEGLFADHTILLKSIIEENLLFAFKDYLRQFKLDEVAREDFKIDDIESLEDITPFLKSLKNQDLSILNLENLNKINPNLMQACIDKHGLGTLSEVVDLDSISANLHSSLKEYLFAAISSMMQGEEAPDSSDYVKADELQDSIMDELDKELEILSQAFLGSGEEEAINHPLTHEFLELLSSLIMQNTVPRALLKSASLPGAGLYSGVVLAATAATSYSLKVCLDEKNKERIESDESFREYCSYVAGRSSQKLVKSKAKGYIAGQKARVHLEGHFAKEQRKRNMVSACLDQKEKGKKLSLYRLRDRVQCGSEFRKYYRELVNECRDTTNLSRRACRRKVRAQFRQDKIDADEFTLSMQQEPENKDINQASKSYVEQLKNTELNISGPSIVPIKARDITLDDRFKKEHVWSDNVVDPQSALEKAMEQNLKFVARVKLDSFISHSSCIFENNEVYVVYHYCRNDRKEMHVQSFEILSKKGGRVSMYIDTYDKQNPPSALSRDKYPRFNVGFTQTQSFTDIGLEEMTSFLNNFTTTHKDAPRCSIGSEFSADTIEEFTHCSNINNSNASLLALKNQKESMNQFWNETPKLLGDFLKSMRSKVETVKF